MSSVSVVPPRRILDVSGLPHTVFDPGRSLLWWGTISLVAIEGTFFALILASYFYLRTRVSDWPPGIMPPDPLWGTINLAIMLVSLVPNHMVKSAASRLDLGRVRILLVVLSLVSLATLVIRWFEFPALRCMWYDNAYASIVWVALGFHTMHLLTDAYDSWVLAALMFTGPIQPKRFMDTSENGDYWYFVVLMWIPMYLVIYWAPRWL
jgi:cytochrome c oxidase subunit III